MINQDTMTTHFFVNKKMTWYHWYGCIFFAYGRSFLLTAELLCLQLCLELFYLQLEWENASCKPPTVSKRTSPKWYLCPTGCPTGRLLGPSNPGLRSVQKCPDNVPGVSKKCPGHSTDTFWTLRGRSLPKGPAWDTPLNTLFSGTLSETLLVTLGPEGPERPL